MKERLAKSGQTLVAFHSADYDTYITLGDPAAAPLWAWRVWQQFASAFTPLIAATRGKPGVRSTQYLPNRAGTVKFGRLGWNDLHHQKWSHGSPKNEDESKMWSFLSAEVWAPTWTHCEREGRAPDLFLAVSNESLGGCGRALLFNPVVILAVESQLANREVPLLFHVLSTLRKLTSAKLTAYKRRPWGRTVANVGFTNAIQDLAVTGLFKPGRRHEGTVGLELFADLWQPAVLNATGI